MIDNFASHPIRLGAFASTLVLAVLTMGFRNDLRSQTGDFRPPAVPLVACDPYFSVWSEANELTGKETTHWTGKTHRLSALIRVDGKTYRLMGATPESCPALPQNSVQVLPTQTIYQFAGAGVAAALTFTTPALPSDIRVLSRPVTYLSCEVRATDAKEHQVEFYFHAAGELATNTPDQRVTGNDQSNEKFSSLKIGTVSQHVLGKAGDDLRIDWGYLYVAADQQLQPQSSFGTPENLAAAFMGGGPSKIKAETIKFPTAASGVAAAVAMQLGTATTQPVSGYVVIAYDDLFSIEYMQHKLRPYWRKDGWEAADLLATSIQEYPVLRQRCQQFDQQLMADLTASGGKEYADIAALAYRQCFAAGKFVADANGQPLQFCKENHSNGCIATSDVFYPMAPQFLLFGPSLTKSVLVPFMNYAASDRWTFPFAPHDLGTYPKANGQVYGGGETNEENQMPVEESGNLLILFAALAEMEGHADFASLYWKQLTQWADYLVQKGFDPENQLCTDDFAGHMAHNVNLSAKAICGIGSYARLCQMRGDQAAADKYAKIAKEYAGKWIATARDGDHFRLAFDRPGTWSQKYNLVWDRLLGLGLFGDEVVATEMTYYKQQQNEFGLALDNRSDYTKLDWILWTATLTGNQNDFQQLVQPVHRFLNATPDRSPMTDWYFTSTAKKVGFTARPVVGGVFLKMLYAEPLWKKYASSDITQASAWAAMPIPPKTISLVRTSAKAPVQWHYTTEEPEGDWWAANYSAAAWKTGPGGFGSQGTPSAVIGTEWTSSDIWIRRSFEIAHPIPENIGLRLHHDEAAQVFLNGKQVGDFEGFTTSYQYFEIPASSLQIGTNVIAIHCHQTTGGQYLDCGIDSLVPAEEK